MAGRTFKHVCGVPTRTTDGPCQNPVKEEGDRCSRYHGPKKRRNVTAPSEKPINQQDLADKKAALRMMIAQLLGK